MFSQRGRAYGLCGTMKKLESNQMQEGRIRYVNEN